MSVTKTPASCVMDAGVSHVGGPKETRTLDLFNAIEALSQLSYRPVVLEVILTPAFFVVNT